MDLVAELSDDELLAELGIVLEVEKRAKYTPQQERIIAGFEDIQRFYESHGHLPRHGERFDIFERLYAVRLDRLKALPEAMDLLVPMDTLGLLTSVNSTLNVDEELNDEDLLGELGVELEDESNIAVLRHVGTREERQAADEVATRKPCVDFQEFSPLFDDVEKGLKEGTYEAIRYGQNPNFEKGEFFILDGLMAYVAEMEPLKEISHGKLDGRLRVIFANGTESGMLYRSFQKSLYKDESGRRIKPINLGGLFGDTLEEGDVSSGTIYVLRSNSDLPFIAENRQLIHKIGMTGQSVQSRISNASQDPTFLFASVEVVATYSLSGVNRSKLETILQRVFSPAQLEISIPDRFGKLVSPKEWFLVPLHVIDDAVSKIQNGTITEYVYSPSEACLVRWKNS